LTHRLKELGFSLDAADLDIVYHRFNELADHRKAIFDQDLISLLPEHHRRGELISTPQI
jgi:2-isopropylmalate synthase